MLQCITNSNILKASLDLVSETDHDIIIKQEFEKMCLRFELNEFQMISLVTTLDISLLNDHYDTIWDGLNYYSMACMDDYKTAYVESIYKTDLMDNRIENLCDDLQEYIKSNSCINVKNKKCNTFVYSCKNHHDICVKYLLNNPQKHDVKNDIYGTWVNYNNTNIIDYMCLCGGSLDVIKYAFEVQKKDSGYNAIEFACKSGNLDVVAYLFEIQKKNCSHIAMYNACTYCHLDIIAYLFEVQKKDCAYNEIDRACVNGNLDIVAYLFEVQKKNCGKDAIDKACYGGHLDIVKYLLEIQKKDCTKNTLIHACCIGRLDIVAYLLETQKQVCTIDAIKCAKSNGHSDVVEYLLKMQKIS